MTNQTETPIVLSASDKIIAKALKEGTASKIVRAQLTIEGIADKKISELLKAANIGRVTSGFTQTNTLKFLEAGVSEFTLYEKIIAEKAKNEARWIGDRNRIRVTLNAIFIKFEKPVTEKPATEAQKLAIKSLLA
jgi:hypothetical protein